MSIKNRDARILLQAMLALLLNISCAHADTLVDPTRPVSVPTRSASPVRVIEQASRVTAIFQFGERRVAVLDGRVVKAGDRIGDIVVQEILSDGVRLLHAGRVEIARLPKLAASVRREPVMQLKVSQESKP